MTITNSESHSILYGKKLNLNFILTYLFTTGYLISICLIGYDNDMMSLIGKMLCYFIVIFTVVCHFFPTAIRLLKMNKNVLIIYSPLLLLTFWILIRSINVKGLFLSLQFALVLLFAITFRSEVLNYDACRKAFRDCYLLLLTQCALSALSFKLFENNNYLAIITLIISVLCYVTLKGLSRYFVILTSTFLLILAGSRAVLLSYMLSLTILMFIQTKKIKIYTKLLIAVTCCVLIMISINTVYDLLTSTELSTFLVTYTGKRAESGRFEIWYSILSAMMPQDYLIGMGGGLDYTPIIGEKLSPHSGYLYILSSYGIIGLFLFATSILLCTQIAWKNNDMVSVSLMLAMSLREFFETTLIHNNFPLAIIFWGILTSSLINNVCKYSTNSMLFKDKEELA